MTRFAIDAPTLLRLAEGTGKVSANHQLVAPNSVRTLALDLLLKRVGSKELSEVSALALHERMTEMKMRLLGDRVSRRTAWRLAREHGWSTLLDAEYIAVAMLQADALITEDPGLVSKAKGIVPLAKFSDLWVR